MTKDASPPPDIVQSPTFSVIVDLFAQLSVSCLTVPDNFSVIVLETISLFALSEDTFCTFKDLQDENVACPDEDSKVIFSKTAEKTISNHNSYLLFICFHLFLSVIKLLPQIYSTC